MSPNTDWDSRSMDYRLFDFTEEDEDILINADFKAPGGGEGGSQSRSSTPESHKNCHGYNAHGQSAPTYSCGCYKYKELERYKCLELSPPDLEQVVESGNGDFGEVDVLNLKQKIRDENDENSFHDITDMQTKSVPDTKLPPSKCRKLGEQSESSEEGVTRHLIELAKEIVVLGEGLLKAKEGLRRHRTTILAICEILATVTEREESSER
ncbi:hypothetical protein EDD22DRAFT_843113 [Suillus occidentalis]|nr:hypothetical protein EDD22DRAFT_843113 [Suillus occidentalis]